MELGAERSVTLGEQKGQSHWGGVSFCINLYKQGHWIIDLKC